MISIISNHTNNLGSKIFEIIYDDTSALIYNRYTLKKAIVSVEIAKFIEKFGSSNSNFSKVYSSLKEKFIPKFGKTLWKEIAKLFHENKNIEDLCKKSLQFKPFLNIFYLIPTLSCNMRCEYCFFPNKCELFMNKFELQKVISIINKVRGKNSKIILYGGEPLLNWAIVEKIIKEFHLIEPNINIQLITNGTLLKKYITILQKYNISISISLDGRKEENDLVRLYQDKSSAFEQIFSNICLLNSIKMPYSISCTVGLHNYLQLPDVAKYFVEDLNARSVTFNILRGKSKFKLDIEKSTEAMLNAFVYLRDKGIYEDRIMRKIRSFTEEKIHVSDCSGCGHQLCFIPQGHIGICHVSAIRGDYFWHMDEIDIEEKIKNSQVLRQWRDRVPLKMPQCARCSLIGICGGGCPIDAKDQYGSITDLDQEFCKHTRIVLNWMVKDLINSLECYL